MEYVGHILCHDVRVVPHDRVHLRSAFQSLSIRYIIGFILSCKKARMRFAVLHKCLFIVGSTDRSPGMCLGARCFLVSYSQNGWRECRVLACGPYVYGRSCNPQKTLGPTSKSSVCLCSPFCISHPTSQSPQHFCRHLSFFQTLLVLAAIMPMSSHVLYRCSGIGFQNIKKPTAHSCAIHASA